MNFLKCREKNIVYFRKDKATGIQIINLNFNDVLHSTFKV